jgi:hypothetical protein
LNLTSLGLDLGEYQDGFYVTTAQLGRVFDFDKSLKYDQLCY